MGLRKVLSKIQLSNENVRSKKNALTEKTMYLLKYSKFRNFEFAHHLKTKIINNSL